MKSFFAQGGIDADEHAILLARRWAYEVKGVKDGHAKILFPQKTFWGRSIAGRAGSDDPYRLNKFGPFGGLGFEIVKYNDLEVLEEVFMEFLFYWPSKILMLQPTWLSLFKERVES